MDEDRIVARLIAEGHLAPKQVERMREKAAGAPLKDALLGSGLITEQDWRAAAGAQPEPAPQKSIGELLAAVPTFDDLLGDLTMADIRAFSTILNSESFPTGKTLFREGDSGERMHIVKGGRVGIVKAGNVVATLRTGDLLGEMSFILGWPRTARAVADGEVELLSIEKREFLKFCNRHAITGLKVVLGLLKVICYRLQAYELALAASPVPVAATILRYDPDHGLTWREVDDLLCAEEAAALRQVTREATFAAGEEIFQQRTVDGALYAIRAGEVDVWYEHGGRRTQVALLGEGYVFGEVGFVLGWPRTASVTARMPTTVTIIDKIGFDGFMAHYPAAALRIIMTLARLISFRLESYSSSRR